MQLAPGSTFAGYTVVRRLGGGGMGEVYLVQNPALGRHEALKVIDAGAEASVDFTERFTREAQIVGSLHHPNIITVFGYGTHENVPWFTMVHLEGHDLTSAHLVDSDVVTIANQTASALDYAHKRGVIHRDVKPANIFLTYGDDGELIVTVLDFGIARLSGAVSLTGTNTHIGTLEYSAPELVDSTDATPAADQYSLACTLYELLTGNLPFTAGSIAALVKAQAMAPAPPLSTHRPDLIALDPVFARALARDPADRFPTCRAFAASLAAALRPGESGAIGPQVGISRRMTAALRSHALPSRFHTLPPIKSEQSFGREQTQPRRKARFYVALASVALLTAVAAIYCVARPGVAGISRSATAIAGSYPTTCAISNSTLWCWETSGFGELSYGTDIHGLHPVRIDLADVTAVATGRGSTCAISGGAPYCWGANGYDNDGSSIPTRVQGLANVTAIATDGTSYCAVYAGLPFCWGSNQFGQVGDHTTIDRPSPIRINLKNVTSITTADQSTCAVADGTAYCWGSNAFGQLGDGTTTDRHTPTRINGLKNVTTITTGGSATCAIADRTAYCWGSNAHGELGDGTSTDRHKPSRVNAIENVSSITTSDSSTCAVADRAAYCWGLKASKLPGDGTIIERRIPLRVTGIDNITAVTTSAASTCAISDGAVYCWGTPDDDATGAGLPHQLVRFPN
ncbi:MAG: protein kinase [Gordonia sp. (in: high G+C Gram-positive bacteria)]